MSLLNTEGLKNAALVWAMEGLHDRYDNFLDMLLGETDDRWLLPTYFTVKFEQNFEDGMGELAILLNHALEHDVLYEHYVEVTRTALDHYYLCNDDVREKYVNLFKAYLRIKDFLDTKPKEQNREIAEEMLAEFDLNEEHFELLMPSNYY